MAQLPLTLTPAKSSENALKNAEEIVVLKVVRPSVSRKRRSTTYTMHYNTGSWQPSSLVSSLLPFPSIQILLRLPQQIWLQPLLQLISTRGTQTQQQSCECVSPPQQGLQQQLREGIISPQSALQTQQRPLVVRQRSAVTIAERVRRIELLLVHYEDCTLARKAAVLMGKKVPRNPQEHADQLTIWTDAAERRRKLDLMIDLRINKLAAMGVNDKVESLREALLTVRARTQVEDNRDVHFPS